MISKPPTNDIEALTMALYLAIISPEDKTEESIKLAVDLSKGMSEYDVRICRRDALRMLSEMHRQIIGGGS